MRLCLEDDECHNFHVHTVAAVAPETLDEVYCAFGRIQNGTGTLASGMKVFSRTGFFREASP